jgi:uncharacterized protein
MKLLVLIGVIVLALMWLSRPKQRGLDRGSMRQRQLRDESIVPCAQCGLHAPASEMLIDTAGRAYCCEEHRRLHAAR